MTSYYGSHARCSSLPPQRSTLHPGPVSVVPLNMPDMGTVFPQKNPDNTYHSFILMAMMDGYAPAATPWLTGGIVVLQQKGQHRSFKLVPVQYIQRAIVQIVGCTEICIRTGFSVACQGRNRF